MILIKQNKKIKEKYERINLVINTFVKFICRRRVKIVY